MEEIILKVEGMMCEGCENRIKNALQSIEGVKSVVANHNTKNVIVTLNEKIEKNLLKERIEDIGFDVKED